MPTYAYAILVAGWLIWLTPFLRARQSKKPAKQLDRRARWGILLVAVAYSLVWQGHFWERSPRAWQVAVSIVFFVLASLLSWTGARALGRQWRIDAGLSADHELITSGPYRFVRHPIYTSMLCIVLGTGFLITPWWLFLPSSCSSSSARRSAYGSRTICWPRALAIALWNISSASQPTSPS